MEKLDNHNFDILSGGLIAVLVVSAAAQHEGAFQAFGVLGGNSASGCLGFRAVAASESLGSRVLAQGFGPI